MLLTSDQQFLLSILREVRYMRLDQILPLMRLYDPSKAKHHCEAMLRYLRYAGELIPVGDNLVCLAEFRGQEADPEMLCALDILLSLAVGPPLQLTSRRPPGQALFPVGAGDWENRRIRGPAGGAGAGTACQHPFGTAVSGCDRTSLPVRFGTAPAFTYPAAALLCHSEGGPPAVL